jgi:predicted nucleic acid-binding protein
MPGKYLLDTNIIIYSFDQTEPPKKRIAKELIKNALKTHKGFISYQVIQEFVNVALQKFKIPMEVEDCKSYIDNFLAPICEIFPSIELFREAIDIKSEAQIGFYDALIVASAIKGNARTLYTEDLNDGQKIRSVQIINPFKKSKKQAIEYD